MVGAQLPRRSPGAPATVSTPMMVVAPMSLAPAVAHRPIGPCANTATVSPMRTPAALGPAEAGRHDVGAHQHLLVGRARPAPAPGWPSRRAPARTRPGSRRSCCRTSSRRSASSRAPCRHRPASVAAAQAGVAVAARRDGAGDHALALAVALHGRAELLDHADRLVADGQALGDRVLALEDVDVGAADRGGRDPHQRVERTDLGDRLLVEHDAARARRRRRLSSWARSFLLIRDAGHSADRNQTGPACRDICFSTRPVLLLAN